MSVFNHIDFDLMYEAYGIRSSLPITLHEMLMKELNFAPETSVPLLCLVDYTVV